MASGRQALGSYARAVGGRKGAARHARAARTGAPALAALAAMARTGAGVVVDGFDFGALAGQPVDDAIAAIVDRFCPPGILDDDVLRAAIADALFEALGGDDLFDPTAVTDRDVVVAAACYVAEIVFAGMAAEQGGSASDVPPEVAVQRENALRDLVREVADHLATPILQRAGGSLDTDRMSGLISEITAAVQGEMSQW